MFCIASLLILLLHTSTKSFAQEIEPRAYSNLPTGSNFIVLNYNYTTGNIISDATSPIKDLDVNSNTIVSAYMRTFPLFGKLARVQVSLPFSFLSGSAKLAGRDTSATRTGLADMRVRFGINLFGSPALDIQNYLKHKDGTIFGASFVVQVPIGQYYEEKLINLGTNRWGFKPEIGLSHRIENFYGELYTGVWFFTSNNEFLKTNTQSTDPLFNIQGQVNYVFNNAMWAGVNVAYSNGGDVKVNDVSTNAEQDNWRFGGVFSTALSKNIAVKLQYHTGAVVRRGSDFDFYSLSLQYFWL